MSTARRLRPTRRRLSLRQYLAGPPDEFKAELIDGELVVSPSPTDQDQDLQADLGGVLRRWVRALTLGWVWPDLDMVLDEAANLAYRPDLLFLARAHQARRRQGRVFGPADLCVEILSPSDRPRVQRRKYTDYARYGVPWYWIINPLGELPVIEELELVAGDYAVRAEVTGAAWFAPAVFPGLHLRLPPLMAGDLKAAVKGRARKLV